MLQERLGFSIGPCGGADDDVHAQNFVDLVEVDFREHDVLFQTHGIVATAVERIALNAAEARLQLVLARLDADCAARRKAPGITKDEKKAVKAKTQRHKKGVVALVLVTNFLVLGYFKYWSYFVRLLAGAVAATAPSALGLVMPLGISFYTFQAIGYLIDCFRGRHPAEKNPARFLLFISFFPQMRAGRSSTGVSWMVL